jgi:hypothetical protein
MLFAGVASSTPQAEGTRVDSGRSDLTEVGFLRRSSTGPRRIAASFLPSRWIIRGTFLIPFPDAVTRDGSVKID